MKNEPCYGLTPSYTLSLAYDCSPKSDFQIWSDGKQIESGGTLDFGSQPYKLIVVTNTGNADLLPNWQIAVSSLFSISPTNSTYASADNYWNLNPLPPNSSRAFFINVNQSSSGVKTGTLQYGYPVDPFANLEAIVNPSGTPPTVSITAPDANSHFYAPAQIPIAATASASSGTITNVVFYADAPGGRSKIGETNASPYTCLWNPLVGKCSVFARAFDSAGRFTDSSPIALIVSARGPNLPPVAVNDSVDVYFNSVSNIFNVMTNDFDPNGDTLAITSVSAQYGSATVRADGSAISYTPFTNSFGNDILTYSISDGHNGTARAKVYVTTVQTTVGITSPADGSTAITNAGVLIQAIASSSDAAITKVEFYANNRKVGERWTPPYETSWTNSGPGRYSLIAKAFDTRGFTTASDPVQVLVANGSDEPIAEILNLTDGQIIHEGSFDLLGTASNANPSATVAYHLRVFRPDDGVSTLSQRQVADLTPATTGRKDKELLAHLDFSMIRNGAYVLELQVDSLVSGSPVSSLTQPVTFILDSNVKIGQFTFTEQDLSIPVSGIPLTVMRTYNSINPTLGDFGYSWTYALNDVDMEIDEERGMVEDPVASGHPTFNMRVGGGRDVTLTLPGGKRSTFYYAPVQGQCGDGDDAEFCLLAQWQAPYGINAKLTSLDDNRMVWLWGGLQWWWTNPDAGVDNFDFQGFRLQTLDGTQYTIQRTPTGTHSYLLDGVSHTVTTYGKGRLTTIQTRNGNRIEISPTAVQHFDASNTLTRSLIIERTNNNLISAIRDPRTATGRPAMKYEYDSNLNLTAVYRLVNTTSSVSEAAAYLKTSYDYTNTAFPHFLTTIVDPRGVSAARSKYDSSGRLIEMTDAAGNTTTFEHDLDGRKETITDPLTNRTVHIYDERGNVITSINALAQVTSHNYDLNNNLLSESDALGNTTSYTYDERGLRLSTTDPLGHSTSLTYDDLYGKITSSTDARGRITTNIYDGQGNLTSSVQTLNPGTVGSHDIVTGTEYDFKTGQPTATIDPLGNRSEYSYDSIGSLVKTTSKDAAGNVLAEAFVGDLDGSSGYDDNGNKTVEYVTRTLPSGTVETNVTRYMYDGQNRPIKTILPANTGGDDYTTQTLFNDIGKPDSTTDLYGRQTLYKYDLRGNVSQTKYPDGSIARTVYDALGRAVITTDKTSDPDPDTVTVCNGNRTVYDELGRAIRNERLTNITLNLMETSGTYACQIQDPVPSVISVATTVYDEAGRVIASTDERGAGTSYGYDDAGRRISATDALGNITSYAYDQNGNQTNVTDALGRSTAYLYDDLNRRVETHPPLVAGEATAVISTLYDDAGRRVAETNLAGVITGFRYDALGRLSAVTNAFNTSDQIVTWYTNDEVGNLIAQKDAEGRVTTFEYDQMGRRTKRTLPNVSGSPALSESTVYGLAGTTSKVQVKMITDFKAQVRYEWYDEMDRLQKKVPGSDSNGVPAVAFTYFPNGQRATMTDLVDTNAYTYDDWNRLVSKVGARFHLSYAHDAKGNVTALAGAPTYGTGSQTIGYTYDILGRLSSATRDGPLITYNYDPAGNLLNSITVAPFGSSTNLLTQYGYDARNRLTNMTIARYGTSGYHPPTNAVASFDYNPSGHELDPTGARRGARETINADTTITRAVNYYYDNLYRLTKEDITTGSPSGMIEYATNGSYLGHDRVGNRRSRKVTGSGLVGAGVTDFTSQGFDARDRLTGTGNSFDDNGNTLRADVVPAQDSQDDEYDYENRLTVRHTTLGGAAATITLLYDGDGNRVWKIIKTAASTNGTFYLTTDQNPTGYPQVIAEYTTNEYGGEFLTRAYDYGHSLFQQRRVLNLSDGESLYDFYGNDGHGNVRFLMDNDTAITDTYTYDAFGILIDRIGTTSNNYLYCSEQFDWDLGVYYNRARYLNSGTGRFITMDTFKSDITKPLTAHKYFYGLEDPVNRADPSGLSVTVSEGLRADYGLAIAYLRVNSYTAREFIDYIEGASCPYNYNVVAWDGANLHVDRTDAETRTTTWASHQALCIVAGSEAISPALLLIHELRHSYLAAERGETYESDRQPRAGRMPAVFDQIKCQGNQLLGVRGLVSSIGAPSRLFIRTFQHTGHPHPVLVPVNLGGCFAGHRNHSCQPG
jgi:RHS repeat-associated protein